MKNKRTIRILMTFCILVICLAGCSLRKTDSSGKQKNNETSEQKNTGETEAGDNSDQKHTDGQTDSKAETYRIAVMKGPTGLGFVKAWNDSDQQQTINKYDCSAYGTADEIVAGLVKGEIDIAAVPCNLASVLYQKTDGSIRVAAINTLGVLYMISDSEDIHTVKDLKGKTIYTTGQGTTPEYCLNYILRENGLTPGEDVKVEYKSEAAEAAALMSGEKGGIAMLPQPYVTTVLQKNEQMKIVLNMSEEWEKISGKQMVTGVVVARDEVISRNEEAFRQFIKDYEASVSYANESVEKTADLAEKYDIIKAAVAKQAIPYCNICLIRGSEMREMVEAYLTVLAESDPKFVGGKLPGDDFFYLSPQE